VAIPYPAGNPELPPEEEKSLRVSMVERAVDGLATQVDGPTHFE
jgi:glycine reductase